MIRLIVSTAALIVFGDMLRRALIVHAYSFVLPLAGLCLWLLVLVIRTYRREQRRCRRKRTGFIRPRSFPPQSKRGIR